MLKYIPNILTVSRFFFIPFILYYLTKDEYIVTFILLTISGITDILDGFIAKKFNLITNFGKLIDPLADKATQLAILFVLVSKSIIPTWILLIVMIKEFAMVAGASFLYGKELVVSSKWYGKCATVLFYIAIVLSLFVNQFKGALLDNQYKKMISGEIPFTSFPPLILYIDKPFYYLAVIITIFSLIMYFRAFYVQGYLKKENLKIDNKQ